MLLDKEERMSQESIVLNLEPRTVVGKRLRGLRMSGLVPAVVYDHGKESVVVQAEYNVLQKAVRQAGKNHIIALQVGKKSYNALIKDVSLDPRKNTITHVVFNAVAANEKVDAEVPVRMRLAEGNESSPAERAGLIVLHNTEMVEVEAFPRDLPDVLYYDGEVLISTGDQITVEDIEIPKGVTITTDSSIVLATVFEPSALAAANDAAGGDAEPGDEADVEAASESEEQTDSTEANKE